MISALKMMAYVNLFCHFLHALINAQSFLLHLCRDQARSQTFLWGGGGGGGGQTGHILGPFMITRGLSCDRVGFGHFGGVRGHLTPPFGYGPGDVHFQMTFWCDKKNMSRKYVNKCTQRDAWFPLVKEVRDISSSDQ